LRTSRTTEATNDRVHPGSARAAATRGRPQAACAAEDGCCREAVRIAHEHQDQSAVSHAEIALEQARDDGRLALELESGLLHAIGGVDGGGFASESVLDDPTREI
jgi:hypothetical protein